MVHKMENELRPELLSIHSINSFVGFNSSSRNVMFYNHISQALPILGSSEKRVQTGVERELGKYTFSVQMPEDGVIIDVIERYPAIIGANSIKFNPETILIYENKNYEIGMISIPYYHSTHTSFGFKYELKEGISQIGRGNFIPKGTIFADSPSKSENGGYKYGTELNIAFMSHPAGAEDGIMVSSDVIDKLKFKVFETRTIEFGSKFFPLNLYGTKDKYKPFPEIGDYVRDDGILMAIRQYDDSIAPVTMSAMDLMEIDYIFDRITYARGKGGKVVDIKLIHDETKSSNVPAEMMENVNHYSRALTNFYLRLLECEQRIRKQRKEKFGKDTVVFTPPLHRLLVEARALTNNQHPRYADRRDNKLNIVYKKEPLDDYRVTFVVEYDITPSVGFKMTGSYGDKGVICSIVDPIHMPVDAEGNRADVIMDAGSTINRMNAGRPYEQYFGSAARDVTRQIRRTLFLPDGRSLDEVDPKTTRDAVYNISKQNPEAIQQAHNTALDLYKICSPKQYERYASFDWNNIVEHVQDIVECGIYLYMPIDNPLEIVDVVKNIEARFKLCYGPVTFINMKGERITTKHPVRIGPYYMMLLEKIADDWSSVAYSKLHHFGILTPMNKFEKYSQPYRNSPIRTMGETESRLYSSYCGRVAAAEMIDRNNNPSAHKAMVATILDAEYPSNVDVGVDRSKIPFGNSKPLQLVRHVAFCYGWEMDYVPGKDIFYEVNHETNKS